MAKITSLTLAVALFLLPLTSIARGSSSEPTTSDDSLQSRVLPPQDRAKILVGEVEDVILLPWAILLPARIDTGATLSALDARDLNVKNNVADFMLGKNYREFRLHLPIVKWLQVRTAVGTENRPVVEIGICLGPKLVHTLVTLSDRSQMIYPFLVGHNVLNGNFMVDTSRSKALEPSCFQSLSRSSLK